jgi:hypothetical protein
MAKFAYKKSLMDIGLTGKKKKKKKKNRQTGSRNLMGPKTLPTIWGTYMKLVTKYQISAINSC